MSSKIITFDEYYALFPYPIEILQRQKEQRERNKQYIDALNVNNPWLAETFYNVKKDILPPGWVTKINKDNKKYYLHVSTKFETFEKPTSTTPTPVAIFTGILYVSFEGKMQFINLETKFVGTLDDGWKIVAISNGKPFFDGENYPSFQHTSGLIIKTFMPWRNRTDSMNIKVINNDVISFINPLSKTQLYYNKNTKNISDTNPTLQN